MHQVPVQHRRRGRLRRQLHTLCARRCVRQLRERACALLPVPPRHDWLSLSNSYTAIRSEMISLIFVCGCCTIKFLTMIWNLLLMDSRIEPVTRRVPGLEKITWRIAGKKDWEAIGKKIAQKSRNICRARGGEVGAEGMVKKSAMLRSPETKYKRSKIIFSVTCIALTSAPHCNKLLEISAQFLIGSPGTLVTSPNPEPSISV